MLSIHLSFLSSFLPIFLLFSSFPISYLPSHLPIFSPSFLIPVLTVHICPSFLFRHHFRSSSGLMMLPALMESSITDGELLFADLIIYPICPTHAQPHTYPMLDSDPEIFDVSKGMDLYLQKRKRKLSDYEANLCNFYLF